MLILADVSPMRDMIERLPLYSYILYQTNSQFRYNYNKMIEWCNKLIKPEKQLNEENLIFYCDRITYQSYQYIFSKDNNFQTVVTS